MHAQSADLVGHRLQRRAVETEQGHIAASLSQRAGQHPADSPPRTRHQCFAARNVKDIVDSHFFPP